MGGSTLVAVVEMLADRTLLDRVGHGQKATQLMLENWIAGCDKKSEDTASPSSESPP